MELATHVWPPLASGDEVPTVPVGVIINVCAAPTVSLQELVSWLFFFFCHEDRFKKDWRLILQGVAAERR